MIVATTYQSLTAQINQYSDEEYLQLQVTELTNMFFNEIAAIKNIQLEYITFTNYFSNEFRFNLNHLGKTDHQINQQSPKTIEQIQSQEQNIIKSQQSQSLLFFTQVDNTNVSFLMRRFPLINPCTKNTVGILMIAKKIDIMKFRKMLSQNFFKQNNEPTIISNKPLTDKQSSIITCLLLGFHKRKEIAHILDNYLAEGFNEVQIKNSLQTLYDRYQCSSTYELIEAICSDENLDYTVPANLLTDGSIPIK